VVADTLDIFEVSAILNISTPGVHGTLASLAS
jgi:hypothetical protein